MDMKTSLVIAVPTAVVTTLVMNYLQDDYSFLVSLVIGAVAGVLTGLVAYFLYKLVSKS